MKFLAFSFILLVSAVQAAEPANLPEPIGEAYGRLGKALGTRNEAGMREVWARDFVVNAPGGKVLRREEVIAAVADDLLEYKDFKKHITLVDQKTEITVVMGYDTMVSINGPGAGSAVRRPFTDIWDERDGKWVLIARQATITALSE